MLEDYEKDAVFALLVRLIKIQRRREEATKALEEAQRAIQEAASAWEKAYAAIRVFHDDSLSPDDLWKVVREELGQQRYHQAFTLAGHFSEAAGSTAEEEALSSGQSEAPGNNDSDSNIKVRVLDLLKLAGSGGTTARTIIDALRSEGVEMHDKTVGMTLYRLSVDGLSRREGRTWYSTEALADEDGIMAPSADVFE